MSIPNFFARHWPVVGQPSQPAQLSRHQFGQPSLPVQAPSTALVSSQQSFAGGTQAARDLEHGYAFAPVVAERNAEGDTVYRRQGETTFVAQSQDLVQTQRPSHNGTLSQKDVDLPAGTRILSHLPLGPEDRPNTREGAQRRKFRNLINWVNELGRLHPDLETARQNNWQEHILKLKRHIGALESQLKIRLRKEATCPIFKRLIPTYPQLWRHLDPKTRRELEQGTASSQPSRMIEAPPSLMKDEDTKASILVTNTNSRPSDRQVTSHGPRSFGPVKREEEQGEDTLIENGRFSARPSGLRLSNLPAPFEQIKTERQDSDDSDDCIIVSERTVRRVNQRNIAPAPLAPRVHSRTAAKSTIPLPIRPTFGEPAITRPTVAQPIATGSTIAEPPVPTRSLRNREVPLPMLRRRSRSPSLSQLYRDLSPRRDAIVEELSDAEVEE
ncbi:hypothetical protein AB5N19_14354 [Seiridium cardinale]